MNFKDKPHHVFKTDKTRRQVKEKYKKKIFTFSPLKSYIFIQQPDREHIWEKCLLWFSYDHDDDDADDGAAGRNGHWWWLW